MTVGGTTLWSGAGIHGVGRCDYEKLYGCDDLVEGEMCYDPCRSDAAGGGTIFS